MRVGKEWKRQLEIRQPTPTQLTSRKSLSHRRDSRNISAILQMICRSTLKTTIHICWPYTGAECDVESGLIVADSEVAQEMCDSWRCAASTCTGDNLGAWLHLFTVQWRQASPLTSMS